MNITRSAGAWSVLEDTPAEAGNLSMRATLMSGIAAVIENRGWSQREAGDNLGLTQSRVCDLTAGRIDTFTLDELCSIDASTWVYR